VLKIVSKGKGGKTGDPIQRTEGEMVKNPNWKRKSNYNFAKGSS